MCPFFIKNKILGYIKRKTPTRDVWDQLKRTTTTRVLQKKDSNLPTYSPEALNKRLENVKLSETIKLYCLYIL